MMRKLLCVLTCCMLLIGLVACGSASQDSRVSDDTSPASDSVAPTSDGSSDDVTIEFWDMPWGGANYQSEVNEILAAYTEETGVQFNYTNIAWDNWLQVYLTAVAAGNAPDVSTGGSLLGHRLELSDAMYDLSDFVAENFSDDYFVPGAVDTFYAGDTLVGVPWNMDARCFFYRTDIFEAEGITDLPTNWDEFYDLCVKLTHGDQYGFVTAGSDGMAYWQFMYWSVSNSGYFLDDDMNSAMANDENVETGEFLRKLYQEGLIPEGAPGYTGNDAGALFLDGTAAMIMNNVSFIDEIAQAGLEDSVEILPVLTSPNGLTQSVGSFNAIFVYNDSEVIDETLDFVKWYLDNNGTLWSEGGMGPLPAANDRLNDAYFSDSKLHVDLREKVIPKTVIQAYPFTYYTVEMDLMDSEQYYIPILQAIYLTDEDVHSILESSDEEYNAALAEMKAE